MERQYVSSRFLLLFFLTLFSGISIAKEHNDKPKLEISPASIEYLPSIKNSQYFKHLSPSLKRAYHIYVRLPESFDESSSQKYPTIYLLDGGITFPLLASYYQYLRFAEDLPEMIIVGISYGSNDFKNGNYRGTDFTAPAKSRSHYGGAAAFQKMLTSELLPLVEGHYPSDANKRILFGQSLGGQFVLFDALSQQQHFWSYIASNPALHRNLEFFLSSDISFKKGENSEVKVFVSRAENDDETFKIPADKWVKHWRSQKNKHFILKETWIKNHNHFSIAPDSFRNGLIWIFETTK